MSVVSKAPGDLTDSELGEHIYRLAIEIAATQRQVEPPHGPRRRTVRLVRATILMAGGLFGATLDLWALTFAALGLWDWIEAVAQDAAATNRQKALKQHLAELELDMSLLTVELQKRKQTKVHDT